MIEAFSEQLLTIDELRARMPHLRARQANLRGQIDALDAQAADRDAYLTLAGDLEGFLAQLRGNANTATVEDRQRVLRLLVKDVLIGPEKITIRHRIPARPGGPGARQHEPGPDTEGDHRRDYPLRWGRGIPPLANVYLHYVFDLWARHWRNRQAHGDVIIVRFADDIVVGFQDRSDAERFQADLVQRFARFNLELNAEKTRLIEFGRFAAQNRRRRGLGRPETFAFLGFTHMCGKTRTGRFALRRKTIAKRMAAKLREVNASLRQRRHWPVAEQGQWLGSVVRGHTAYYGVPGNIAAVSAFRKQVTRLWGRCASAPQPASSPDLGADGPPRKRDGSLPPGSRILGRTSGSTPVPKAGAQCGSSARWDLCGGPPARAVPTGNDGDGRGVIAWHVGGDLEVRDEHGDAGDPGQRHPDPGCSAGHRWSFLPCVLVGS